MEIIPKLLVAEVSWFLQSRSSMFLLILLNLMYPLMHAFLASSQDRNSFHLKGKKLDCLHLKNFVINYECKVFLKQSLSPSQCKIIPAYRNSHHRLVIETCWWSIIPISRDNMSYRAMKMRHTCWIVPSTIPLKISAVISLHFGALQYSR